MSQDNFGDVHSPCARNGQRCGILDCRVKILGFRLVQMDSGIKRVREDAGSVHRDADELQPHIGQASTTGARLLMRPMNGCAATTKSCRSLRRPVWWMQERTSVRAGSSAQR